MRKSTGVIFEKMKRLLYSGKLEKGSDPYDDRNRRIEFSNAVFISLPIVYVVFMAIDFRSYLTPIRDLRFDQLIVPIIILVCLFCLWLNKMKMVVWSRLLFLLLWPILLHLIPIKMLLAPPDYMLAYPLGIIFHSVLVQLMYSHRREALLFWSLIILNFVAMITSPEVLTYYDTNFDIPRSLVNYKYYFYDGILYWLLFNLVMFYVLYVIESYILQINTSKDYIGKQSEKLDKLNHNLEAIVSERTQKLEEQNKVLQQHAYFNAHLLRGPFCRIAGLVQMQDMALNDPDEETLIRKMLFESLDELDSRIQEIQQLVNPDAKINEPDGIAAD